MAETKKEQEAPEVVGTTEGQAEQAGEKIGSTIDDATATAGKKINEALKQFESFTENIGRTLSNALQDRTNVVMVRVNDDSLRYLDMLVEADITKSRSESAAFLINEGIKGNEKLFNKIRDITDQIVSLRTQLRDVVGK